jgi:Kef-type K+ transport system membrane component KefB
VAEIEFINLLIVAIAAFASPLLLGLFPSVRLPAVVVEIVAGIIIGPDGFGWVEFDTPVRLMSLLGLSFLLLLAGLEVEYDRFRGRLLRLTGMGYVLSLAIALVIGFGLDLGGLVKSPLLIAIILSATGLGIIIPVLKDTGQAATQFGQVVIAGASIAEIATIVLLSLFFSGESSDLAAKLVLLALFSFFVLAIALVVLGFEHSMKISATLVRLQDTTAEIRVRGAFVLLAIFVVLADQLGLEAILGAFLAGAILKLVDRDEAMTHPQFRHKLEAVGFGVFIPFFFVGTGVRYDLDALYSSGSTAAKIPVFLVALLLVRGLPALFYRPFANGRQIIAAGLLQATSLGFLVVAGQIGVELDLIRLSTYSALVAAGLLSVVIFPLAALTILRRAERPQRAPEPATSPT